MAFHTRFRRAYEPSKDARKYFSILYEDTRSYAERMGGINEDGQFNTYHFNPRGNVDEEQYQESLERRKKMPVRTLYREEIALLQRMNRACARCGGHYTELENFQWACRYHPGRQIEVKGCLFWTCCQKPCRADPRWGLSGCLRCDHRDSLVAYNSMQDQRLPCVLVDQEIIPVCDDAIVHVQPHNDDETRSFYEVKRYEVCSSTI